MTADEAGATLRVAAIQLRVGPDKRENIDRAAGLVDAAAEDGAKLVLLPEIFSAPFVQPTPDLEYFRHAEALDGESNAMAEELSRRHGITIVSPIFEEAAVGGVYYNAACTYDSGRLLHVYRKSHLPFSNGFPEKFYFRPGDEPPQVVEVQGAATSTIICYERHFPELPRSAALAGAEILFVPVACASAPTRDAFEIELRAHAIFNGLFVVCANRVGAEEAKVYYGTSGIYGPDGSVIAQADTEQETVVIGTIDLNEVGRRRRVLPFFRDRRPELYARLTAGGSGSA